MSIKGWYKSHTGTIGKIRGEFEFIQEYEEWRNSWTPFVDKRHRHPNTVSITRTMGGWWQVFATSAPVGEIGTARSRKAARAIAVAFMRKYPHGHPAAAKKYYSPGGC